MVDFDAFARCRVLNDALRTTLCGGRIILTHAVQMLGRDMCEEILAQVALFEDWDDPHDPFWEHDLGFLTVKGIAICFEIASFQKGGCYGSPHPANPAITTRVMTIMRAEELGDRMFLPRPR